MHLKNVHVAEEFTVEDNGHKLEGLGKLNVFIGPNNTGKSRLLRSIFNASDLTFLPADEAYQQLSSAAMVANEALAAIRNEVRIEAFNNIVLSERTIELTCDVIENKEYLAHSFGQAKGLLNREGIFHTRRGPGRQPERRDIARINDIANGYIQEYENLKERLVEQYKFKKIYIPSLRTLRRFAGSQNLLRDTTIKEYFPGGRIPNRDAYGLGDSETDDVIAGMELYAFVRSYLLGTLAERGKIAEFENFLGAHFFKGQTITLIPRERTDNEILYIKIGSEKEQPIHLLGEGIQQLIILTIPLFLFRDQRVLLFIEEPEVNLHPGYQHLLIDALIGEENKSCQVFVATHSHQFLDITLAGKLSVFRLGKKLPDGEEPEKTPTFTIERTSDKEFELLAELGVRNSSVLLSNCTIWVEGITDRWYIRRYFEVLRDKSDSKYLEDLHYSFVEYGGSCITHWSFLDDEEEPIDVDRLCGKVFLVADHDDGRKEVRHKKLRKSLGKRFHPLACREIENLLTPNVLCNVIRDYANDPKLVLPKLSQKDYEGELLGKFIDDTIPSKSRTPKGKRTPRSYAGVCGTIKDKVAFARKAIDHINSPADVSPEAKSMIKKIVAFIKEWNP